MKKKLLAILLTVCMVLSMAPAALATGTVFTDVDADDWFAEEVEYVYDKGLMNGVGDNKFDPDGNVTRAMMWTTLARLAGVDTSGSEPWWLAGQLWAVENGISDGTMAADNITREQLVTMLWRYAQYMGYDVSVGENTNILSYTDAFSINEWAFAAMQWGCGAGIINGMGDGSLAPQGYATRAQLAAILYRFVEEVLPGASEPEEEEKPSAPPVYVHYHSYGDWTANDDGTHSGTCACGETETVDCYLAFANIIDATHDEVCSVCGYTVTEYHVYDAENKCECGKDITPTSGETTDPVATLNGVGYDTIAEAVAVAAEGDVITVLEGNHVFPSEISTSGITIVAANENVKIDVPAQSNNVCTVSGDNVTIAGFDFAVTEGTGSGPAVLYITGDNVVVENCSFDITGTNYTAVQITSTAAATQILDCDFTGGYRQIGNSSGEAGSTVLIEGCTFGGHTTYGIHFDSQIANATIKDCVITAHNAFGQNGDGNLVFENVHFKDSDGEYNQMALHRGATFIDCTFDDGFALGMSKADKTVTFNGGTWEGWESVKARLLDDSYSYDVTMIVDGETMIWDVTDKCWYIETEIDGIIYLENAENNELTLYKVPADYAGTTVNVAEGTTAIGSYAFYYNSNIETIVLPSSVTTLNDYAFRETSASTIVLNEGLEIIGYQAFSKTANLTSVEIPSTVTTIGEQAFRLSGVTEIVVPANVTSIGAGAFRDMTNLTTITFEGDDVVIPNYVCRSCADLTTVYILGENITFSGTSMAFTHADNGTADGITIYVANETVKTRLEAAQGSANGYTIVVASEVAEGVFKHADSKTYDITSKEGLMNLGAVLTNASPSEANILTVNLTTDVDLTGETWTPLDNMWIVFNGNDHTISNLTAGFDSTGRRSGFWGYAGAVTINDLTLENVTVTGSQAGTFAGSAEGLKINNSYLKGANTVNFASGVETWNGIGAITGVLQNSTVNVTIAEGATVILNKGAMTTDPGCVYVDNLTGYIQANKGTITNNGTVTSSAAASTDDALDAAIKSGATTVTLGSGNYIIPDSAQGKTLTIVGNGETVIATQDDGSYEGCDYSLQGSTVTFENVTINTDSSTYTGYARLNATYNNCTINGTYTLYGDSVFNNCTFNVSGDAYNIWTWGAPNATFNNCTFNSDGKAMLLYGTVNTNLILNGCTFNDNGGLTDLKAAIEIGDDYDKSYTLIVNNTVVNGYEINDKGINTGTTLWANKNSMGTDKLNVVVDGVDVY